MFNPKKCLVALKTDDLKLFVENLPLESNLEDFWNLLGSKFLSIALQSESFNVARFLIDRINIDLEELHRFCLANKAKVSNQDKAFSFITYLACLKTWIKLFGKPSADYYRILLIQAIQTGDLAEVKNLTISNDNRYLADTDGNSLIQIAIIYNQFTIVRFLVESEWYLPIIYKNNKGLNALDLARALGFIEIIHYLEAKYDNSVLDLLQNEITLNSLMEKDDLGIKGISLMLHYYVSKIESKLHKNILVVFIYDDSNAAKIMRFIDTFIKSTNTLIYVYHDDAAHKKIFVLEKLNEICYVNLVDSLKRWDSKNDLITQLNSTEFIHLKKQIVLCKSESNQQTATLGCRYFALKNLSMIAKFPSFTSEILQEKYFVRSETDQDIAFLYYRLPPMFMHLATSPAQLKLYIEANEDSKLTLRTNKSGEAQDLLSWSHQSRDKYGVKTPELINNRDYDSSVIEGPHNQQYVVRNNSLKFFQTKYISSVLPQMLSTHSQAELRNIISLYDARTIKLDEELGMTPSTSPGP